MDEQQRRWAARLQEIARTGLERPENVFSAEHFADVAQLAQQIAIEEPGGRLPLRYDGPALRTPYAGVRGALFNEAGQVLLVHERINGGWAIPGGFCDVWDTPTQAILREIREEAGLEARVIKLVAVYDRRRHDHSPNPTYNAFYMFYFLCEALSGTPGVSNGEISEAGYFAMDALPPLSADRLTLHQLTRCHAHWLDRSLPTEFD